MALAQHTQAFSTGSKVGQELAIEINGLTKLYKELIAVKELELAIPRGIIFGFLGPNGAGKTTTIRMLLGLIKPTSGTARILGFDTIRERAKILPLVGAIVETPTFYPYLSGRDNLREAALLRGKTPASRLDEVLELVELTERAKDKVKTYSLGMKQRLGIALALLNQPQVIFLDEPTNGLDPQGTVDMRNLILRLGQSGQTVFLSSHLLYEVEQVCSHVAIINKGTVLIQGEVQQLLQGKASVDLEVDAVPLALEILSRHFNESDLAEVVEPGRIQARINREQIPAVVEKLVAAGVQIYAITPHKASLEDYFLAITSSPSSEAALPN